VVCSRVSRDQRDESTRAHCSEKIDSRAEIE
jgi:hypothetical protein